MQMPVFLILFLAPVYVPLGLLNGGSTRSRASTRSPRCSRPGAASSRASPDHTSRSTFAVIAEGLVVVFSAWAPCAACAAPSAPAELV